MSSFVDYGPANRWTTSPHRWACWRTKDRIAGDGEYNLGGERYRESFTEPMAYPSHHPWNGCKVLYGWRFRIESKYGSIRFRHKH